MELNIIFRAMFICLLSKWGRDHFQSDLAKFTTDASHGKWNEFFQSLEKQDSVTAENKEGESEDERLYEDNKEEEAGEENLPIKAMPGGNKKGGKSVKRRKNRKKWTSGMSWYEAIESFTSLCCRLWTSPPRLSRRCAARFRG